MLLQDIVDHIPPTFGAYWEPFAGAGSLFFLLQPTRGVLNDACIPLMDTYRAIRDTPDLVLQHLHSMEVSRDSYYRIRAEMPTSPPRSAAIFIYLNKVGWNGLYRVNSAGRFNVPYGRPKSSNVIDDANLRNCSSLLLENDIQIRTGDFEDALQGVQPGDLVYLDPPYVTAHNNNGFIEYNQSLFSWTDQTRLADVAHRLVSNGATVIVSNADHEAIRELYASFRAESLSRPSTLASRSSARRTVTEALFIGIPR